MNYECSRSIWNGYWSSILKVQIWVLDIFQKCYQYILEGNFNSGIWTRLGWFMSFFWSRFLQKITSGELKDYFKKVNNICIEAFVLAFKPLYLQNLVLSYFGNNSEHFILQLVPKEIYFYVIWRWKGEIFMKHEIPY